MKKAMKVFGSVVTAVLLLTVFTGAVLASGPNNGIRDGVQEPAGTGQTLSQPWALGFVDADGDGVNDRYQSEPQFVDQDGDGACDLYDGTQSPAENYAFGSGFRSNRTQVDRFNYSDNLGMMGDQLGTCIIR